MAEVAAARPVRPGTPSIRPAIPAVDVDWAAACSAVCFDGIMSLTPAVMAATAVTAVTTTLDMPVADDPPVTPQPAPFPPVTPTDVRVDSDRHDERAVHPSPSLSHRPVATPCQTAAVPSRAV